MASVSNTEAEVDEEVRFMDLRGEDQQVEDSDEDDYGSSGYLEEELEVGFSGEDTSAVSEAVPEPRQAVSLPTPRRNSAPVLARKKSLSLAPEHVRQSAYIAQLHHKYELLMLETRQSWSCSSAVVHMLRMWRRALLKQRLRTRLLSALFLTMREIHKLLVSGEHVFLVADEGLEDSSLQRSKKEDDREEEQSRNVDSKRAVRRFGAAIPEDLYECGTPRLKNIVDQFNARRASCVEQVIAQEQRFSSDNYVSLPFERDRASLLESIAEEISNLARDVLPTVVISYEDVLLPDVAAVEADLKAAKVRLDAIVAAYEDARHDHEITARHQAIRTAKVWIHERWTAAQCYPLDSLLALCEAAIPVDQLESVLQRYWRVSGARSAFVNELVQGRGALHVCAANSYNQQLEVLVREGGGNVLLRETTPRAWTPFHHAAAVGNVAALALCFGVLPMVDHAKVHETEPLLHVAVEFGQITSVRWLLEYGVDVNMVKQSTGMSAVHVAARQGNANILRILIAHGANLGSGLESAAAVAALGEHYTVLRVLFEHGGAWLSSREWHAVLQSAVQQRRPGIARAVKRILQQYESDAQTSWARIFEDSTALTIAKG